MDDIQDIVEYKGKSCKFKDTKLNNSFNRTAVVSY